MECLLKHLDSRHTSFGAWIRALDLIGGGSMIWVKGALAVLQLKQVNQQQNAGFIYDSRALLCSICGHSCTYQA